jgi:hypothetical protein
LCFHKWGEKTEGIKAIPILPAKNRVSEFECGILKGGNIVPFEF